jgi:V8-like Glu-specific endopeptidase
MSRVPVGLSGPKTAEIVVGCRPDSGRSGTPAKPVGELESRGLLSHLVGRCAAMCAIVALAWTAIGCGSANSLRRGAPPIPASDAWQGNRAHVLPFALAAPDDYVVRVVAGSVACSGTLIADDRVLTAHHCVSGRNDRGEFVNRDVDPSAIRVELGGDYMPWGEVGVRAVVAPPCGHSAGEGDIAILVLERSLVGAETLPARLDRVPRVGESVTPVGFGRCVLDSSGIRRQTRSGGRIEAVRGGRFRLQASICPGDSGGPAVGQDGELVGVISASVMDGSESTRGLSEFTRLDRWRPVFANAQQVAEGVSPAELPPPGGCSDQ